MVAEQQAQDTSALAERLVAALKDSGWNDELIEALISDGQAMRRWYGIQTGELSAEVSLPTEVAASTAVAKLFDATVKELLDIVWNHYDTGVPEEFYKNCLAYGVAPACLNGCLALVASTKWVNDKDEICYWCLDCTNGPPRPVWLKENDSVPRNFGVVIKDPNNQKK